MIWLLAIQVGTFVVLGGCFLLTGEVRLGLAQFALAAVQALIYFPN